MAIESYNNPTGADGVKIAVFRKGRASLEFIWAAAQWRRSAAKDTKQLQNVERNEKAFTVSDWLGCILVLILIFTLIIWPLAVAKFTGMFDDFGGSLPQFTYLFLKTKLSSYLGIFTLVYFSLHFTSWVKSSIRRRRLWVVSSFIMSLIALALCTYALYLPIFKMAGAIE